jgi:hypothetical protein
MKHVLFLVMALLAMSVMTYAQTQQTDIEFDADVANTAGQLTISASANPTWNSLHAGVAYNCIAENVAVVTNITPLDPALSEAFAPGQLDITGGAGKQVALTFVLPTKLVGTTSAGVIHMSYDNQSAGVVNNALGYVTHFFNPQGGQTLVLDATGIGTVFIGGNPTVDNDVDDGDTFVGYGLVSAEYTGL